MQDKFKKLREETDEILKRMKNDFDKLKEARDELERELFEKDEELAKKDTVIKNLTQKQLELGEAMLKF